MIAVLFLLSSKAAKPTKTDMPANERALFSADWGDHDPGCNSNVEDKRF